MPRTCQRSFSSGVATSCSTSSALAPGKATATSAMGTTICGSSSRGVTATANTPASAATTSSTGDREPGEHLHTAAVERGAGRDEATHPAAVVLDHDRLELPHALDRRGGHVHDLALARG